MEFVFEDDNGGLGSQAPIIKSDQDGFNFQDFEDDAQSFKKSASSRSRRTLPKDFNNIDFTDKPKRKKRVAAGPKVNYVKPIKKKRKAAKAKFEWSWTKLAWIGSFLLVMRLFFMDSGVIDYHQMNKTLDKKTHDLELIRQENANLIKEIHQIRTSTAYQKKLTRDHLGVIAKDEYLVLFAGDRGLESIQ